MKKVITLLLFNFILLSAIGQTYEEIIASKTCDCISEINNYANMNTSLKRCILQSKFEVEKNDGIKNPNNTIIGMRQAFQKINELVTENCDALQTKKSEYKKTLYYKDSKNKEASFNLHKGNKLLESKEYTQAIKAFKKALYLDANFVLAYDQLGMTYKIQEAYKKAIKAYKKSLDIFPEGDHALQHIGELYFLTDDNEDASVYYTSMVTNYPENPAGYLGLAKTELKDELNESALVNTGKALKLFDTINSDRIADATIVLTAIYDKMEAKGNLDIFNTIAKENQIDISKYLKK